MLDCWAGDGPLTWDPWTAVPVPSAQAPFAFVDDFTRWVPRQEGRHPLHGKPPTVGCPQHTPDSHPTAGACVLPWMGLVVLLREAAPCTQHCPAQLQGAVPLFSSPPAPLVGEGVKRDPSGCRRVRDRARQSGRGKSQELSESREGRQRERQPLAWLPFAPAHHLLHFPLPGKSSLLTLSLPPTPPPTPCTKINREAERRAGGAADLAGLVCSSMASTALSTELSSDWVWFAVSFSRKRVTNWSTLLPLSYTCQGRQRAR